MIKLLVIGVDTPLSQLIFPQSDWVFLNRIFSPFSDVLESCIESDFSSTEETGPSGNVTSADTVDSLRGGLGDLRSRTEVLCDLLIFLSVK